MQKKIRYWFQCHIYTPKIIFVLLCMKKFSLLTLTLLVNSCLFAQIPAAEAYYPFCNDGIDRSGNGRNATVVGCYGASNRFAQSNNGFVFGGAGYIDIPNTTIMGFGNYTYSMWLLIGSNPANTQCVFSGGGNDIYDQNLLMMPAGYLMAVSHNSGGSPSASSVSSPTITLNKWHHVVVNRNSTLMQMYVDNVLYTGSYHNGTSAVWGNSSPYNIFLGVRSNGLDYFNGQIDDVRLFGGTPTTAQVAALYHEAISPHIIAYGDSICEGETAIITASGANSFDYPGTPPGYVSPATTSTYAVTGNSLGCVATVSVEIVVNLCTGINELAQHQDLSISPNPTNGSFKISGKYGANNFDRYSIQDLSGRTVLQGESSANESTEIKTELPAGTYVLRVYAGNTCLATKKLIVIP